MSLEVNGTTCIDDSRNATLISITGLTTPLSVAQGGTGSATGAFEAGTRMPFAQAAAPTGWTQDVTDDANNRMLRVVSGAGGGVAGSHSPILNNVTPAHTHGITTGNNSADHTHSIGDPTHRHTIWGPVGGSLYGQDVTYTHSFSLLSSYNSTGVYTGNQSVTHTHSGTTDNGSSQTNWAPRYIDMIICTKS